MTQWAYYIYQTYYFQNKWYTCCNPTSVVQNVQNQYFPLEYFNSPRLRSYSVIRTDWYHPHPAYVGVDKPADVPDNADMTADNTTLEGILAADTAVADTPRRGTPDYGGGMKPAVVTLMDDPVKLMGGREVH